MAKRSKAERQEAAEGRAMGRTALPNPNGGRRTGAPGPSVPAVTDIAVSTDHGGSADPAKPLSPGNPASATEPAGSADGGGRAARAQGGHRAGSGRTKAVATGWDDAVIVCRKCQKRIGAAYGPDRDAPFRKALRGVLKASGRRGRTGVVQAGCFGVCPKRGVTLMRASEPGTLLVVTPSDLDTLFPAR
jgi:hypothetical protein